MTAALFPSLLDIKSHLETQKRAEAKHSVRRAGPFLSHMVFKWKLLSLRDLETWQACGEMGVEGGAGPGRNQTTHLPKCHLPSSSWACPCVANSPRTHNGAVSPGNIGGFVIPGRRCRGHVHLIINSTVVNGQKRGKLYSDYIDLWLFILSVQILLSTTRIGQAGSDVEETSKATGPSLQKRSYCISQFSTRAILPTRGHVPVSGDIFDCHD